MINSKMIFHKLKILKRGLGMNTIKSAVNKIKTLPAKPETPYPQVISWLFSFCIMLMLIYICDIIGM